MPVLTAISLAGSGLGPPTLGLVSDLCDASFTLSESCFLVLSSNLSKAHGLASFTEAGGGLGPPRPPVGVCFPTVDAAMAAACCVFEFSLRVDEAEPRREMLSSEVTSGNMACFMSAEIRQFTRLDGSVERELM